MAILLKCGALFLHVPKTGGAWVSEVLEEAGLVFANVGEIHDDTSRLAGFEKWFRVSHKYAKPNRPFFRFCFVRHPLRWYESWFKFQTGLGWPKWGEDSAVWHPNAALDGLGDSSFVKFAANVLDQRPGYVAELYGWYTTPGVHFVGRHETLVDDLAAVLHYLHLPVEPRQLHGFKPVNVSKTMDIHWPPELQEAVERAEYAAFKRFGYKTEVYRPPETAREPATSTFKFDPGPVRLKGPFVKDKGHGWIVSIPQFAHLADDLSDPYRSALTLQENGQRLPFPHTLHAEVCRQGRGRFCHWKADLYFSTSDNSNPNTNGRAYQIQFQFGAEAADDGLRFRSTPRER